jgi:hypothetical protein
VTFIIAIFTIVFNQLIGMVAGIKNNKWHDKQNNELNDFLFYHVSSTLFQSASQLKLKRNGATL